MRKPISVGKPVYRDEIESVFEMLDVLSQQEELRTPSEPRFFLTSETFSRHATTSAFSEFYFYEYDRSILVSHDVDFASPNLPVHYHDFVTGPHEVFGGDRFSVSTHGSRVINGGLPPVFYFAMEYVVRWGCHG